MFELRQYQKEAVQACLNWIRFEDKPAILSVSVGGGKTIIARFIAEKFCNDGKKVIYLANRLKLIQQAEAKLIEHGNLIVSTIQSAHKILDFTPDLIICDECQYLDNSKENGLFWEFINKNKQAKLIGMTGTPYRTKGGKLNWGEMVYEVSYPQLLKLNHVTSIINKAANTPYLNDIDVSLGDYNEEQLVNLMIDPELLKKSVETIEIYTGDRKKNLIFCINIRHSEILCNLLNTNGLFTELVSSKTSENDRERILNDFEFGNLPRLINCELLTVGYDNPRIDMITCLRPTKSKNLWEQMLGRGVRLFENKIDCLLIDMAGNLEEHGGLGTPCHAPSMIEINKKAGRICPECETFVQPVTARECPDCGYEFPEPEIRAVNHKLTPDMQSDTVFVSEKMYFVTMVEYAIHTKRETGSQSLRIDYYCYDAPKGKISEWLPKNWRVEKLFRERGNPLVSPLDSYSLEDLVWKAEKLTKPTHIIVSHKEKFPKIISVIMPPIPISLDDEIIF